MKWWSPGTMDLLKWVLALSHHLYRIVLRKGVYICFEDWQAEDEIIRLRCCNHWLHEDCLSKSILLVDIYQMTDSIMSSILSDSVVPAELNYIKITKKIETFVRSLKQKVKYSEQSSWSLSSSTSINPSDDNNHNEIHFKPTKRRRIRNSQVVRCAMTEQF